MGIFPGYEQKTRRAQYPGATQMQWLALFCLCVACLCGQLRAQSGQSLPLLSFRPADTLHTGRLWVAGGVTATLYTGSVIALNEAWYKQFPRTHFHLFNDWHEWQQMDKAGHLYTGYFESLWAYRVARWTGMNENPAIWLGAGTGLLFQTTVEILDGFSAEWGFSLADMGFNVLGTGAFVVQQMAWKEQRVMFKVSSTPVRYPETFVTSTDGLQSMSLPERSRSLFGRSYAERFLKDYNAQTVWMSVNVYAFLGRPESRFPKWLNVAIGYGAGNMYGGFGNSWHADGAHFVLDKDLYPRYRQYFLSPDIDFTKIPSRSPFVRTLLGIANVFKMPGPVLEYNRIEGMRAGLMW